MGDLEVNARASLGVPRPSHRADSPPEKKVADFDARSTTPKYYSQCKQSTPYSPQWLLIQGIVCVRSTIPLL